MRHSLIFSLFLLSSILVSSGCARHDTHGTEKEIRITANFTTSGGDITITSPLTLDSTSATEQDTAGTSTISPPIRMQLTEGGSTAGGDSSPMSDVRSRLESAIDSGNTTTTTTTTQTTNYANNEDNVAKGENVVAEVDDDGEATVSEDLDYNSKETFTSYGERNGGRKAWRIPKKGPDFGSQIKVVFSDGHTVLVKDTSHNYRESDGFVFKPGIGPNGEGEANTGTSHGGVYLHAPYGNKSMQATFYYNKP